MRKGESIWGKGSKISDDVRHVRGHHGGCDLHDGHDGHDAHDVHDGRDDVDNSHHSSHHSHIRCRTNGTYDLFGSRDHGDGTLSNLYHGNPKNSRRHELPEQKTRGLAGGGWQIQSSSLVIPLG